MARQKPSLLIAFLMGAANTCASYSPKHPVVQEFTDKALLLLPELLVKDTFSITVLGETLLINDAPYSERTTHIENLMKRLKRKGVERLFIRKGVGGEELKGFLALLTASDKLQSTPHIVVGRVEVRHRAEGLDVSSIMDENVEKVRGIYQGISRLKTLDVVGLEDAVASFISTLKREMNLLRIISPVKSYSEYTYVHASNVSVLTIFQAEALGLKGEMLHEAGLAGLLHDAGKMLVSRDILEKQAKLSDHEWAEIRQHPSFGAMYLSTLPELPRLAIVAAFEHHMKFDGTGYPETRRRGRKQHIISQIVALSDFFDALRTERPYRKPLDVPTIVGLITKGSGKDFNPVLVDNFLTALSRVKVI